MNIFLRRCGTSGLSGASGSVYLSLRRARCSSRQRWRLDMYLQFERAVKRRLMNRYDMAEYSLAVALFAGALCAVLLVFLLFVEIVERLSRVLF